MLSELCQELRNWFDRDQPHIVGTFEIIDGKIVDTHFTNIVKTNQYFRISGSVFNDGVHQYTDELSLIDEEFKGSINLMAVPKAILDLSKEIDDWVTKYEDNISSPYASESFGGYSYSKLSGSNGAGFSWQNAFASKLNLWRKI